MCLSSRFRYAPQTRHRDSGNVAIHSSISPLRHNGHPRGLYSAGCGSSPRSRRSCSAGREMPSRRLIWRRVRYPAGARCGGEGPVVSGCPNHLLGGDAVSAGDADRGGSRSSGLDPSLQRHGIHGFRSGRWEGSHSAGEFTNRLHAEGPFVGQLSDVDASASLVCPGVHEILRRHGRRRHSRRGAPRDAGLGDALRFGDPRHGSAGQSGRGPAVCVPGDLLG
jgi:hypothetical protein